MKNEIRYYFPSEPLNITRIILRSLGLYLVIWPHMVVGMTVVTVFAMLFDFFAKVLIVSKSISLEPQSVILAINYSTLFYSSIYYLWKIKHASDNTFVIKFTFVRFLLRNFLQIIIAHSFLYILVFLSAPFNFFPLFIFIPTFVFLIPLIIVGNRGLISSLKLSFTLIWNNWYFLLCTIFSLFAIVIICSTLLSGNGFALFENYNFFLMMHIYRWYIVVPFLSGFILLLLNNALLRKGLEPLPRLSQDYRAT